MLLPKNFLSFLCRFLVSNQMFAECCLFSYYNIVERCAQMNDVYQIDGVNSEWEIMVLSMAN